MATHPRPAVSARYSTPTTGRARSDALSSGPLLAGYEEHGTRIAAGHKIRIHGGDNFGTKTGTLETPVAVVATAHERLAVGSSDVVAFGSAERVHLRIGHSPIDDHLVAPVAGAMFVHRGRVVVANHGPRFALDIATETRALRPLSPGDWHSPIEPTFTVVVQGALTYELHVSSGGDHGLLAPRPADGTSDGECVKGDLVGDSRAADEPGLTDRQRTILDAYVAPMALGLEAATHQQVADTIGLSRQTVRLECARIFDAFLSAGVPMRDRADAHDAIADAWARHRL